MKIHQKGDSLYIWCPGCDGPHAFNRTWAFNENFEKPTIHPSLGVSYPNEPFHCHSFVNDGMIQFLSDSKHSLSGQTVALPDYPENYK